MEQVANYRVLLFYKYIEIENPEEFTSNHLKYCQDLGIKGRILISSEGINGTLSGTIEETDQYIKDIKKDQRFSDMLFKIDEANSHAFAKMHVRTRTEIVNLSLEDDINPNELTGNYLKPEEWLEAMQDPNTVIIDARNDYEYDLGHFRNAVKPNIRNFRQLPNWIRENREQFEGKKILTYCTGGVRCEKFSGWLKREGFEDVNQLEGGIHTYGTNEHTQGQLWDGKMYVFDERLGTTVNRVDEIVVGKDFFTNEPCERYVNCGNPDCNKQMIISKESEDKYLRACSHECRISPRNRYVLENNLTADEVALRLSLI